MADPTPAHDPWEALSAAHFALIGAADHIQSREGWSTAYLATARAADKAHAVLMAANRPGYHRYRLTVAQQEPPDA